MKILLLGANGQLGRTFLDDGGLAAHSELVAASRDGVLKQGGHGEIVYSSFRRTRRAAMNGRDLKEQEKPISPPSSFRRLSTAERLVKPEPIPLSFRRLSTAEQLVKPEPTPSSFRRKPEPSASHAWRSRWVPALAGMTAKKLVLRATL